jgi:colicin import membrane protein
MRIFNAACVLVACISGWSVAPAKGQTTLKFADGQAPVKDRKELSNGSNELMERLKQAVKAREQALKKHQQLIDLERRKRLEIEAKLKAAIQKMQRTQAKLRAVQSALGNNEETTAHQGSSTVRSTTDNVGHQEQAQKQQRASGAPRSIDQDKQTALQRSQAKAKREAAVRRLRKIEEAERRRVAAIQEAEERARRSAGKEQKRGPKAPKTPGLDAARKKQAAEETERKRLAAVRAAKAKAEKETAARKRLVAVRATKVKAEKEAAARKRLAAVHAAEAAEARRNAEARAKREAEEIKRKREMAARAAEAKAQQEAAARKQRETEEAERKRLAAVRAAEVKAQKEAAARKQREAEEAERKRLAAIRKAEERALQEVGIENRQQAEDLAAAEKQRLKEQDLLRGRLNSALSLAREVRRKADQPPTAANLPPNWADEERTRLELEGRLRSASTAQSATKKVPSNPIGQSVKLRLKGSAFEITGVLKKYDRTQFVIAPPNSGDVTVPADRFDCVSDNCPDVPK